jgi:hypothetical protein
VAKKNLQYGGHGLYLRHDRLLIMSIDLCISRPIDRGDAPTRWIMRANKMLVRTIKCNAAITAGVSA